MLMEDKLQTTIDKILRLCAQNPDFDSELRKKLNIVTSNETLLIGDERINQIYEYCLERVVRKQAEDFYSGFPMQELVNVLVDDYCRMEFFRRKDAFGDFCLALYQQIECVTNNLCSNPDLDYIAKRMWGCPAYVITAKDTPISIENRRYESAYSIASLVFYKKNIEEKSESSLQSLYATEKVRTVVYYLGYKATMRNADYESYKEITSLLNDIYQCRNMNHRGSKQTEWEEKTINRIFSQKAVYYHKFLGALTLFIEQIKEGWSSLGDIKRYAEKITPKT